MGRRILAVTASCAALLLAALRSGAEPPAPDAPFAWPPEPGEIRPDGTLRVDGRRVEASTFSTDAAVEEVIAAHRALFARAPVDVAERAIPAGRLLSVLDVHGGRHLVVQVRRVGGRTEVVRGWTPLGEAEPTLPLEPLPTDWLVFGAVDDLLDDSALLHRTALAPTGAAQARGELAAALGNAGWQREPGAAARFARGSAFLEATFEEGPTGTVVQLLFRGEVSR